MEIREQEIAAIEEFAAKRDAMLGEIRKVIVGQEKAVEEVLIALFSKGHCLLVGVPGLAKTLLIGTLAEILDLEFNRIQFTPDLMPSDITGTDILQEDATGRRKFQFLKGPIFTNILLADEINRTPPKTQAALLQSMQEYKVTAGGTTYPLDLPFFVLATQNPIEQEGTYPLPEAQLDRFMLNIEIQYPPFEDEVRIVMQTTSVGKPTPHKVMDGAAIRRYQDLVRRVPASPFVIEYAVSLSQKSRPQNPAAPQFVKDYIEWGAGPRASQYLILGAKSRTILQGRYA
ncbi:MAG: AAA family ATPase, partial [Candidatus Binatota bacterium]